MSNEIGVWLVGSVSLRACLLASLFFFLLDLIQCGGMNKTEAIVVVMDNDGKDDACGR